MSAINALHAVLAVGPRALVHSVAVSPCPATLSFDFAGEQVIVVNTLHTQLGTRLWLQLLSGTLLDSNQQHPPPTGRTRHNARVIPPAVSNSHGFKLVYVRDYRWYRVQQ